MFYVDSPICASHFDNITTLNYFHAMHSILAIDDEAVLLNFIQGILEHSGFSVVTANDGLEGIKIFDKGKFDLVITDVIMPNADGCAVAAFVREKTGGSVPVIGISGTPWMLDEKIFDAVLAKPFSIDCLLSRVRSFFSRK